jgi:thiol:disulfide interchange protein DsbA
MDPGVRRDDGFFAFLGSANGVISIAVYLCRGNLALVIRTIGMPMRSLRLAFAAAALVATTAFASPTDPKPGVEYTMLAQPQPSQSAGKRIEVIEFFMYHCPHCRALEPVLQEWVKKQGDGIIFRRMHMPYQGAADPEAHLFLTLQAMGKDEEMQSQTMEAMRRIVMRDRMASDQAITAWAMRVPGMDQSQFLAAWNSFGVTSKLRRLPSIVANDYKVDGVPTIIVDGKYVTSVVQLQEAMPGRPQPELFDATIKVVEALIAKARAGN